MWSDRWDLNPRPQPWQGCAIPDFATAAFGSRGGNRTRDVLVNSQTPTANIGPLNKNGCGSRNRTDAAGFMRPGCAPALPAINFGGQCRIRTGPFGLQDQRAAANTNRPSSKFGLAGGFEPPFSCSQGKRISQTFLRSDNWCLRSDSNR
jgi:hypothetical protein